MSDPGTHPDRLVRRAARRIFWAAVLVRSAGWAALVLGVWLALLWADHLLGLPAGLRLPLALAGFIVPLVLLARLFRGLRPHGREHTAVALERVFGIPDNVLINTLQFENRAMDEQERAFAKRTIRDCRRRMPSLRLAQLWDGARLRRRGGLGALLLACWAAYLALYPRQALNAATRYVRPMADRPPAGAAMIDVRPSGTVTVPEGEPLEITARLTGGRLRSAPVAVWSEGTERVPPERDAGEQVMLTASADATHTFTHTFSSVTRPFSFRVFAGRTWSPAVLVRVRRRSRITESWTGISPPGYTGRDPYRIPGPPAPITALPGSGIRVGLRCDPPAREVSWMAGGETNAMQRDEGEWTIETGMRGGGLYRIEARQEGTERAIVLAEGEFVPESDRRPRAAFDTSDRNRLLAPGAELELPVRAEDDYGLRSVSVTVRDAENGDATATVKDWTYIGPPGREGEVREVMAVTLDPGRFEFGRAYIFEARARDWNPAGEETVSKPVVVRVQSPDDYRIDPDDPLAPAFEKLRDTLAAQKKSLALTRNLRLHLDEAVEKDNLDEHRAAVRGPQQAARSSGAEALELFVEQEKEGEAYALRLGPLVNGEMAWVLEALDEPPGSGIAAAGTWSARIEDRQQYILAELIALLGKLADRDLVRSEEGPEDGVLAPMALDDAARDLKNDLDDFLDAQERIIDQTRTLADRGPEDLTDEEEEILGALAREEAEWAEFFHEKLTDFSKLPEQDFADSSLSQELVEIYHEVKLAAAELYEKKIELAVPTEQAGAEQAEELVHNLEKWLQDTPDYMKWVMEDVPEMPDIPLAELPAELEDIVGELFDTQESMTEDIEDISSAWAGSIDKGAGWTAMDGPISSMGAKGITGSLLPNSSEIGGRSGEGRTGRSHGQMVEETAVGKGGRKTPTRLTPSPFEQGSVDDQSTEDPGGATGGGKVAGYGSEGLRGPAPDTMPDKLPRLISKQTRIRQEAEALALKLRRYNLPSGDLESSIRAMRAVEDAAQRGRGLALRQAHTRALDSLRGAERSLNTETGLQREQTHLPEWMREEILSGYRETLPRGYETLIAEYFRVLAGGTRADEPGAE
ncbi:DUF4175 family protein [Kiritimatiella glycovorans]|uniref:DUF4175 family protein n=1 Tax=Kiritimatiella glycovorans TaxID=1307763 RepID=A0A0G3EAB4_9BACT|nr:DUF4175 family protein [Kiritimatiella glycovorans]AKJ63386.1 hypothetical protein L21SP4_00100 [Kiritimatiella glycovorans]